VRGFLRDRSELEVHAGPDQVFSQTDADGNWDTRRVGEIGRSGQTSGCRAVHAAIAEIDIEPFDFGGPVVGEGPFDTSAAGPARLRVGGRDPIEVRLHIGEGAAGCEEEQRAIRGITGAPAHRCQPVIAGTNALACQFTPSVPPTTPPLSLREPVVPGKPPMAFAVNFALPQPQPPLMPIYTPVQL
jgi:hypothetical protein